MQESGVGGGEDDQGPRSLAAALPVFSHYACAGRDQSNSIGTYLKLHMYYFHILPVF